VIDSAADIGFDVVGAELHADRDAAGEFADSVTEATEVFGGVEVGKRCW
jgi:hypothetical protein